MTDRMTDRMARHTVVVDLGYGDAGKGTVVDWLCASQPVHAVIRFNGGAQAGHNVVTTDGRHHTFSQFGSGTLQGVRTHLSRYMIVDPLSMAVEADHLVSLGVTDPYGGLSIDRDALLSTPYHRAANQAAERARGNDRHGSCGMGIGETAAYALAHPDLAPRAGDVGAPKLLAGKLAAVRDALTASFGPLDGPPIEACLDAYAALAERVRIVDGDETARILRTGPCVFEAAQGVLLDEWRGFHPYTTWSTTTAQNAMALLTEAGQDDGVRRLGVVRTYTTRHGAGPLVTEDAALSRVLPDAYNTTGPWQGGFRVGHFDAVAHRYAIEVAGGIDALAITHADVPARVDSLRVCRSYRLDGLTGNGLNGNGLNDNGASIDRIVPGAFGDLDYQATLTRMLASASPVLDPGPPADWPATIAELLDRPIAVTSHGPTAADKRLPLCAHT
jgi:adenylosuccinate synthase